MNDGVRPVRLHGEVVVADEVVVRRHQDGVEGGDRFGHLVGSEQAEAATVPGEGVNFGLDAVGIELAVFEGRQRLLNYFELVALHHRY